MDRCVFCSYVRAGGGRIASIASTDLEMSVVAWIPAGDVAALPVKLKLYRSPQFVFKVDTYIGTIRR